MSDTNETICELDFKGRTVTFTTEDDFQLEVPFNVYMRIAAEIASHELKNGNHTSDESSKEAKGDNNCDCPACSFRNEFEVIEKTSKSKEEFGKRMRDLIARIAKMQSDNISVNPSDIKPSTETIH